MLTYTQLRRRIMVVTILRAILKNGRFMKKEKPFSYSPPWVIKLYYTTTYTLYALGA